MRGRGAARAWALPAALLVLLLLLPAAAAQEFQGQACQAPILSVQDTPRVLRPGTDYNLLFAIDNPNGPPVDAVRATVTTTAPAGWTAVAAQRDLTLGPKNVSVSALAVTTPNRGTGAAEGNITIVVTFVCTSGDIQTSAFSTETVEVAIEQFQAPWPLVLGGFAILAAGVGVLGVRRLRRGVALSSPAPERAVEPGKSVKFTLLVENRRGKPQSYRLRAEGVPEGWGVHLALADVELEPGEEKHLWAILKAPPHATLGQEVPVALVLADAEGREAARTGLLVRVGAGEA